MKRTLFTVLLACLVAGCGTLPPADCQVRLSEIRGVIESGPVLLEGEVSGSACVLSVVGCRSIEGIKTMLQQGSCAVHFEREQRFSL